MNNDATLENALLKIPDADQLRARSREIQNAHAYADAEKVCKLLSSNPTSGEISVPDLSAAVWRALEEKGYTVKRQQDSAISSEVVIRWAE